MSVQPLAVQSEQSLEEDVTRFLKEGAVYCNRWYGSLSEQDVEKMRSLLQLTFLGREIVGFQGSRVPERLVRSYGRLYKLYSEKQRTAVSQE